MQPGYPGQDPYGQQPPDPTLPPYQDPYAAPASGQPYGQPTSGQPGYGQPAYQDPYAAPASGQPAYPDPYAAPASGQPYGQPTSGQPGYGQPAYPDPYAAPNPGQVTYGQPGYGQPGYGQPTSGQPYGANPGYPAGAPGFGQPQSNTLGLLAMVLGIASIPVACCNLFTLPLGVAAVVLGFLGRNKADQGLASNRGQAVAGLVCGAIGSVLGITVFVLQLVFQFGSFSSF